MTYANLENLLADYLPDVEKDEDLAAIGRILENVSAFVDTFCDRTSGFFNPSPDVATVKRVRGEGHRFLRLPVHVFGSLQEIDGKPFAEYSAYLRIGQKRLALFRVGRIRKRNKACRFPAELTEVVRNFCLFSI